MRIGRNSLVLCSIVWYKNKRTGCITGWENASSLNYPLREFVLRAHYVDEDKRFIRDGPFPNLPIITACHPTSDVRIIVDGIHEIGYSDIGVHMASSIKS